MKEKSRKNIYLAVLFGAALLSILFYRYFAPFGKEVRYSFVKTLPGTEAINSASYTSGQPMHLDTELIKTKVSRFSVQVNPKTFNNINVNFKFRPGQNEIVLGVRGDEKQAFYYQPLFLASLQDITWKSLTQNGLTLYQKVSTYANISDFLKNPPKGKKVGLYHVDQNVFMPTVAAKDNGRTLISTPLRGDHTLYIQVASKTLDIKVAKQDINMYAGEDRLKVRLFNGNKLVMEKVIGDDGITDKSQIKAPPAETEIKVNNIDPGVYRLELISDSEGSDFQITKIDINQKKVVFSNHMFFLGSKPTNLYTSAPKITLETAHDTSVQTVQLNNAVDLPVTKASQKYPFDLSKMSSKDKNDLYHLYSPNNDLIVTGEGYYAFSPDSFFTPNIINAVNLTDFVDSTEISNGVDYILTTLSPVKSEDGWLVSTANINPRNISLAKDNVFFSLEIPDLDKHGGSLEINTFDVTVTDKTLVPTPSMSQTANLTLVVKKESLFDKVKALFARPTTTPTITPTPTMVTPTATPSATSTPTLTPTSTPSLPTNTTAPTDTPAPTSTVAPTNTVAPTATPIVKIVLPNSEVTPTIIMTSKTAVPVESLFSRVANFFKSIFASKKSTITSVAVLPTISPTPTAIPENMQLLTVSEDKFSLVYSKARKLYVEKEGTGNRYTLFSNQGSFAIHVGPDWSWETARQYSTDLTISGQPTFVTKVADQTLVDFVVGSQKFTIQCVHHSIPSLVDECQQMLSSFHLL